MFNSTLNKPTVLNVAVAATFIAALAASPLAFAQEHEHGKEAAAAKEATGEVIDMMCYVDHGATGDKHASCAQKCVKGGGPVVPRTVEIDYLLACAHRPGCYRLTEVRSKTSTPNAKLTE